MGWSWWEEGLIWVFDEGEAIDSDVVEEDARRERREKMAWAESSRRKKNFFLWVQMMHAWRWNHLEEEKKNLFMIATMRGDAKTKKKKKKKRKEREEE
jgi:hypothetical protein